MMRKGKEKEKGQHTNEETLLLTNHNNNNNFPHSHPPTIICYEGEGLLQFLQSIHSKIHSDGDGGLPLKFWLKQNFAIGVNEVTRLLERMPPAVAVDANPIPHNQPPPIQLQVILLASDSSPRSLIKHLPSLASSRKVSLIFVKDKKGGSLKLGQLVKLKTSIAIGVKAKRNAINQLMEGIIGGNQVYNGVEI